MLAFLLIAAQAATPADIELRAKVRAGSLTIEKSGAANVTVTANGENLVAIDGPKANSRKQIRNPAYNVRIEARIAGPTVTDEATGQEPN